MHVTPSESVNGGFGFLGLRPGLRAATVGVTCSARTSRIVSKKNHRLFAHFTPKFLSLRGAPLRSAQDAGALEGAPRKTPAALRHS